MRLRPVKALVAVALFLAAGIGAARFAYPFPFRGEVTRAATRFEVDPALVAAVIRTESRFRPQATSPRGARGLMQVMPDTGAWVASRLELDKFGVDDLYDPEINVTLGTFYLKDLSVEFGGDIVLILAAYNGGRQNVKRWLGGDKTIPIEDIPFAETRSYVRQVLRAYSWYQLLYGWEAHRGW
ncbi:MAG: lytic transglycosylase domain-containing protein [Bacillota bacterium]